MTQIDLIGAELRTKPKKWLLTGVAGFIGSNLLEALLGLEQQVVGLDNFSTGYRHNLQNVREIVGEERWSNFLFHEGDIQNLEDCQRACIGADYVLHQAALGSVPRSIDDPIATNRANVDGFLNMLVSALKAGTKRFVYASSSSVYGDSNELPKVEDRVGNALSPYATSKLINELYAGVFTRVYGLEWIGLRYFNVFGKRQDPQGAYAAVIPRWIDTLLNFQKPVINGDGETSRDFCYIRDVVQANILAALSDSPQGVNKAYNIAVGDRTTLNQLMEMIKTSLSRRIPEIAGIDPGYGPFRKGDVRHTQADISRARDLLGYVPEYAISRGIEESIEWYIADFASRRKAETQA